jgi:hypothetical protein
MKKTILFIGLSLAMIALATPVKNYPASTPPAISLPDAYVKATNALSSETNQYHCISAKVVVELSEKGEWQFMFYTTNSNPRWVTVDFNGKVYVEKIYNR